MPRSIVVYGLAIAAIEIVGGGIGYVTAQSIDAWYEALVKPPFNPPNAAFGIVWPILYALIAVAGMMVLRSDHPARRRALVVFAAQLAMNFAWSFIFFAGRMTGLGAIWIVLLLGLIVWTIAEFRTVRPVAALLLVPYALWVAFAAYLNVSIRLLNG